MRVRQRVTGGFTTPNVRYSRTRPCGGSWTVPTSSTTMSGTREIKTTSDVVTPGFAELKKLGRFLPLNPFVVETERQVLIPIDWKHERRLRTCSSGTTGEAYGPSAAPWNTAPYDFQLSVPFSDAALQAVVNSAVAKAKSYSWDVATSMVELPKTVSWLRGRINSFFDVAERAVKRANRRPPGRTALEDYRRAITKWARRANVKPSSADLGWLAGFGALWMEYRYAVLPLYYDINDAITALNRVLHPALQLGRGYQVDSGSSNRSRDLSTSQVTSLLTEVLSYEVIYRGWAAAEVSGDTRFRIDPLVTAYEVLPYSWMVDWFFQIGTWIEAISPFATQRILGSCGSVSIRSSWTLSLSYQAKDDSSSFGYGSGNGSIAVRDIVKYSRAAQGASLPGFNPRMNLQRYGDLLGLIASRNSRVLRTLRI